MRPCTDPGGLIDQVKPAVSAAQKTQPTKLLDAAIIENVRRTRLRIAEAQPLLSEMIAGGKLTIAGGVYDIATGGVRLV